MSYEYTVFITVWAQYHKHNDALLHMHSNFSLLFLSQLLFSYLFLYALLLFLPLISTSVVKCCHLLSSKSNPHGFGGSACRWLAALHTLLAVNVCVCVSLWLFVVQQHTGQWLSDVLASSCKLCLTLFTAMRCD